MRHPRRRTACVRRSSLGCRRSWDSSQRALFWFVLMDMWPNRPMMDVLVHRKLLRSCMRVGKSCKHVPVGSVVAACVQDHQRELPMSDLPMHGHIELPSVVMS